MKILVILTSIVFISTLFEMSFFEEIPIEHYQTIDDDIISGIKQARLPFIENQGQIQSDSVKYYAKTFAGTVYVTDSNLIYQTIKKQNDTQTELVINEKFLGNSLRPQGNEKSQSIVNYFKGTQDNWKTNIPTYDYVSLGQVWDNVDVDLKAHGNNVEKIFTIHQGGSPSHIKISLDGISSLGISARDELKVNTDLGDIFLSKPIGYQMIDGKRHDVPIQYDVLDSKTYGFSVLSYNPKYDLVIDPLITSTFIGGSGDDYGYAVTHDSSGNVYITGVTVDAVTDFPTTGGAYDTTHNGSNDVFVSKFNSTLTALSASTFIGGSGSESGNGIAIDSSGNVYITGYTLDDTTDFPTTGGAYDTTHNGAYDVFVSKLNSALTTLSASTLIGGSANDYGYAIALDTSGNVYITGVTVDSTTDFPTTGGAYDTTHNGSWDVFVSKLNSALTTLSASTFIGGDDDEYGYAIALDTSGNVYITGVTIDSATDFPTTGGAYDTTPNGAHDVFVSKFNSTLATLSASTFIGGNDNDYGYAIAIDSSGNVYITGYTVDAATDFPTTGGAYDTTHNGSDDVFVSKFNSALSTLSASTLIGGSGSESGNGITIDSSGNVYITGYTVDAATDFPTTGGAYDTTHNGNRDVFVSKFNSTLTTLSASTFIGGSGDDYGYALVLDSSGNVYITGRTQDSTTDLPTKVGAYDTSHNGSDDAFVSEFDSDLSALTQTISSSLGATDRVTVSVATTVTSGGSVSRALPANGTLQVTLPTTNVVSVTLPSTTSGTITVATTDAGNSGADVAFLGTLVNITPSGGASCSTGCTISFTFTGAQATSAGFTPSEVKLFHDSNEDGSFQSSEAITTTITGSDPYTATGSASFTSKFAVGGIKALAVAGANALSGGYGWLDPNPCDPGGFASGVSLRVYETNYDRCVNDRFNVLAYSTCGPLSAELTTSHGTFLLGMPSDQPYLNDKEKKIVLAAEIDPHLESFDMVVKDKRDSFTDRILLTQCNATKTYSHVTGYTSEQQGFSYNGSSAEPQIRRSSADVDTTPVGTVAWSQTSSVVDPEPIEISSLQTSSVVDPEPVSIDPEPTVNENSNNNLIYVFFKTIFKIFHN